MKKTGQISLVILIVLLSYPTFAQSPLSVKWLNNSKGTSWDLVSEMVIDKENNIYVVGNYKDTASKDKRMMGSQENIFIAKYNSGGDSIWLHQLKADSYSHIKSIEIGSSGQSYICGYQYYPFDKEASRMRTNNQTMLFVNKLDDNGEQLDFAAIDGNFNAMPIQVLERNGRGILVGGSFHSIVYADSSYKSKGKTDIFLYTFDARGEPQNLHIIGGYGENKLNDIKTDSKGNIYCTGAFEKEIQMNDTVLLSNGRTDSYFIKLDSNLNVLYVKQLGGIYADYGKSIEIDSLDNVYLSGSFTGNMLCQDKDTLSAKGKLDVFIMKYNDAGKLLWKRSFGGTGGEYLASSFLNSKNDLYLNGSFRGIIEEGEVSIKSKGHSTDVFLAKYTAEGQFRFIEAIGDTNTDYASRLVIDSLNYIYMTGNFSKSMKIINDTTDSAVAEDYYLTKLYDCDFSPKIKLPNDTSLCGESFVIIADSGFAKYLWNENAGNFKYTADTTNYYLLKATDDHGCITIDTIFVAINQPRQVDIGDDLLVSAGEPVTLQTNEPFAEYLWSTDEHTPSIELATADMKPGEYTISITTKDANACLSHDQLLLVIEDPSQISVYPVPTRNTVNLLIKNIEPGLKIEYQMVTEVGALIMNESQTAVNNSFSKTLHIENLEPGVYYLNVQYQDISKTFKVVKL